MTQPSDSAYDVVIVGGGLVGASLAVALAPAGLSLAVVEAAADSSTQPSFDERTVALTDNARRIYTGMGVWAEIAALHAQPIHEIQVSDRGSFRHDPPTPRRRRRRGTGVRGPKPGDRSGATPADAAKPSRLAVLPGHGGGIAATGQPSGLRDYPIPRRPKRKTWAAYRRPRGGGGRRPLAT